MQADLLLDVWGNMWVAMQIGMWLSEEAQRNYGRNPCATNPPPPKVNLCPHMHMRTHFTLGVSKQVSLHLHEAVGPNRHLGLLG